MSDGRIAIPVSMGAVGILTTVGVLARLLGLEELATAILSVVALILLATLCTVSILFIGYPLYTWYRGCDTR